MKRVRTRYGEREREKGHGMGLGRGIKGHDRGRRTERDRGTLGCGRVHSAILFVLYRMGSRSMITYWQVPGVSEPVTENDSDLLCQKKYNLKTMLIADHECTRCVL